MRGFVVYASQYFAVFADRPSSRLEEGDQRKYQVTGHHCHRVVPAEHDEDQAEGQDGPGTRSEHIKEEVFKAEEPLPERVKQQAS